MLVISSQGNAVGFFPGIKILTLCESEDAVDNLECIQYLAGVDDTVGQLVSYELLMEKLYCRPDKVTLA